MTPTPYTEDTLVQQTTADYLEQQLGWVSVYAYNHEDFGPDSLLGRASDRDVVLERPLRERLTALNPGLPGAAYDDAVRQIVAVAASQTIVAREPGQVRTLARRRAGHLPRRQGQADPAARARARLRRAGEQSLPVRARAVGARQSLHVFSLIQKFHQDVRIVEEYNREKDRVTIERTFEELLDFVHGLDREESRAVREGLDEEVLAIFDLLHKADLSGSDIKRIKGVAVDLLRTLKAERLGSTSGARRRPRGMPSRSRSTISSTVRTPACRPTPTRTTR